jgi:hypothetical protein
MATLGILGHINGGSQLLSALEESSESTSGAADIVAGEVVPLQSAFMSSMYHFAVPTLKALNDTVFRTISLDELIENMEITNDTLALLPQATHLQALADDLEGIKNDLQDSLDAISVDVEDLSTLKTGIIKNSTEISLELKEIADGIRNLSTVLGASKVTVNELSVARDALLGPSGSPGGYVGSLQSDLNTFTRGNSPGLLENTTYSDAASSMSDLIDGTLNGKQTNLNSLIVKLDDIRAATIALPNYNTTADNLVATNNTINALLAPGGSLDDLTSQLNEIEAIQDAFPDAAEINLRIMALLDAADSFSCGDIADQVRIIEGTVDLLPDKLNAVVVEVAKIGHLRDLVDVLYNILVVQKERVQNNLYNITQDTRKIFNDLNGTITDVLDLVDEISVTLTDAIVSIDTKIDFSTVYSILDSCSTSVNSTLSSFDRSAITAALDAFEISTANLNITEYLLQVEQIRSLLKEVDIPEHFVHDLHLLQLRRERMQGLLVRVVGLADADYRLLVKGYCSGLVNLSCASDTECSSHGTCVGYASYRCKDTSTSCTLDSDCVAPNPCLNDATRATELKGYFELFALSSIAPDTSSLQSDLSAISSSSAFDLGPVSDAIDSAIGDIGTSASDIDSYRALLDDMIAAVGDYDVSEVQSAIDDARDAIDDVDLSQVNETLDKMADVQNDVADSVKDAIEITKKIKSFFYDADGLHSHFDFFSKSNLELIAESGAGNLVRSVFGRFDSIVDYFVDALSPVYEFDGYELRKRSEDAAWTLDRMQDSASRKKYGSLYYLLSLSNSTAKQVVGPEDPNSDTIIQDRNGDKYTDGEYCATKECFQNTADYLATYPLVDNSQTDGSVDTTFESVVGYVWIAPAIAAFIGLITLLCPLFTANNKWRRCPATCWLICVILQLGPFLILTGIVFPLAVISSDSCTTYTHVGQKYVTAYGDPMCDSLGGKGTLTACEFKSDDIAVTVDLEAIAYGFLGDCSRAHKHGKDAFGDPLRSLSSQLRSKLRDSVQKELFKNREVLNDVNPNVKNIVVNSSIALGDVLAIFVDSNADLVFTCSRMAAVLDSATSPVCDDGVGSFSWYLATLYLMAWCMCCCGLPAGCAVQAECDWREKEKDEFEKTGRCNPLERSGGSSQTSRAIENAEEFVETQASVSAAEPGSASAGSKGLDDATALALVSVRPDTDTGGGAQVESGSKSRFSLVGFGAASKEVEMRPSAMPSQYYDVDQDDVYGTDV